MKNLRRGCILQVVVSSEGVSSSEEEASGEGASGEEASEPMHLEY